MSRSLRASLLNRDMVNWSGLTSKLLECCPEEMRSGELTGPSYTYPAMRYATALAHHPTLFLRSGPRDTPRGGPLPVLVANLRIPDHYLAAIFCPYEGACRSTIRKILRKFCRRYLPCQDAFPDVTQKTFPARSASSTKPLCSRPESTSAASLPRINRSNKQRGSA